MKKRLIPILIVTLLVITLISTPKWRTHLFVLCYHADIEERLAGAGSLPADDAVFFGYQYVNHWNGDHPMTEFVIASPGDTYYGCYYSPDDVPLAFQNVEAVLTQNGHDYWEWQAEGDNHGSTSKIRDHWYYFEASF